MAGRYNKNNLPPLFAKLSKESVERLIEYYDEEDNSQFSRLSLNPAISKDATIDCIDNTGRTALHIAVENNDIETVKILLENNADLNIPNPSGETPLHFAIIEERPEMAQLLIQYKPEVDVESTNRMILLQCVLEKGYTAIFKYLLEQGVNVNSLNRDIFCLSCRYIHKPALHIAVEKNYPEIVEMLMAYGADVNLKNADGKTALHIAVEQKYSKCIEILIRKSTTN